MFTRLIILYVFQAFGPESFSTLQRSVKDDVAHPSLGLVVQLLRLSRLDPDVFIKFRATLVDQVTKPVPGGCHGVHLYRSLFSLIRHLACV